ncbi:MAG: fructose-6-phosphate aldolase [Anaplasmataceae bacterium]|nr:fructose-6-phosphate aldolase [Anaplasmataceae bacterium]
MKLFIDTADKDLIIDNLHIIKGVTTNPSLVAVTGKSYRESICDIIKATKDYDFDISAEVVSSDYDDMLKEALNITFNRHDFSPQKIESSSSTITKETMALVRKRVVVKLPLTKDGIKLCQFLEKNGVRTNITLCFSIQQALMAMNAGASFISVFVGRVDDLGYNGLDLIAEVQDVIENYRSDYMQSEIIAASIRSVNHINELAKIGVDIATIPPKILTSMYDHTLTTAGLKKFTDEWNNSGASFI